MMQAAIEVPSSSAKASRAVDPRSVALGNALLAVDAAIIEMRAQLKALGVDPEPVVGPLWKGYHQTSDRIDKVLSR
jgi:hypothetical protein